VWAAAIEGLTAFIISNPFWIAGSIFRTSPEMTFQPLSSEKSVRTTGAFSVAPTDVVSSVEDRPQPATEQRASNATTIRAESNGSRLERTDAIATHPVRPFGKPVLYAAHCIRLPATFHAFLLGHCHNAATAANRAQRSIVGCFDDDDLET